METLNINDLRDKLSADIAAVNALNDENESLKVTNQKLTTENSGLTADYQKSLQQIESLKIPPVNKARFGVNVHLFDPAYADTDNLIAQLVDIGIFYIRSDFDIFGSGENIGKMIEHQKWIAMKPKFDAAGIKVRPMFYMRGADGYAAFKAIATLYPYFDEIEIGNEVAIASKSSTMTDGLKASDYDTDKLNANVTYIFNAYRALLQAPQPIKIITSVTWIHYYFIEQLHAIGTNISLSIHSYTDGFWNVSTRPATSGLTAWRSAKSRFGDMVFEIGEGNYMPTDLSTYTDAKQLDRASKLINETYMAGVNFYLYEFRDRPQRPGREGVFGIVRSDGSYKPLANYIKSIL